MRQLETLVGADAFRDGLRDYLRRFAFGNATWPDLIQLLDDRTPDDLATWSRAWVDEAARPIITHGAGRRERADRASGIHAARSLPRRGLTWNQQFQVALGYADRVQLLPIHLTGASVEVTAARGLPAPLFVLPNGGGIAYGEFHLDPASLAWLSTKLADIPGAGNALTRGSAWTTLWDAMLDAELAPDALIDLALRALPRETDELNVQQMLGGLSQAYWRFTPDERRARAGATRRTSAARRPGGGRRKA